MMARSDIATPKRERSILAFGHQGEQSNGVLQARSGEKSSQITIFDTQFLMTLGFLRI